MAKGSGGGGGPVGGGRVPPSAAFGTPAERGMAAAAAESNIVKKLPPGVEEVKAPLGTETHYYKDGVFYIPIPGGGYRKWSPTGK